MQLTAEHKDIVLFGNITKLVVCNHLFAFFLTFISYSAGYLGVFADIVQNLFIYIGGAKQSERKLLVVVLFFIINKVINRYTEEFCDLRKMLFIRIVTTSLPICKYIF